VRTPDCSITAIECATGAVEHLTANYSVDFHHNQKGTAERIEQLLIDLGESLDGPEAVY
jgi:hypothetical protein